MCTKIINLTLAVVREEIESTFKNYPNYPYQELSMFLDLQQSLINYVMGQIPNTYSFIEETQAPSNQSVLPHYSEEERLHIENLIHPGIHHAMQIYHWPTSQ
jgi:hypothetical protein